MTLLEVAQQQLPSNLTSFSVNCSSLMEVAVIARYILSILQFHIAELISSIFGAAFGCLDPN